jgi:hypothetical protein
MAMQVFGHDVSMVHAEAGGETADEGINGILMCVQTLLLTVD